MTKRLKRLAALLLLLVVLVFTFQNTDVIKVRFLGWTLDLSQALIILATFTAGPLLGWAASELLRLRGRGKLGNTE